MLAWFVLRNKKTKSCSNSIRFSRPPGYMHSAPRRRRVSWETHDRHEVLMRAQPRPGSRLRLRQIDWVCLFPPFSGFSRILDHPTTIRKLGCALWPLFPHSVFVFFVRFKLPFRYFRHDLGRSPGPPCRRMSQSARESVLTHCYLARSNERCLGIGFNWMTVHREGFLLLFSMQSPLSFSCTALQFVSSFLSNLLAKDHLYPYRARTHQPKNLARGGMQRVSIQIEFATTVG